MPTALLPERAVLRVSGEAPAAWLQGLVTCNVETLPPGEARPGALLSPQGKILADFLVGQADGEPSVLLLDVPQAQGPDLARRLLLYRLRARVAVEPARGPDGEPLAVVAAWGSQPDVPEGALAWRDARHPDLGWRLVLPREAAQGLAGADPSAYEAHRIGLGVPEGGRDYAFGDAFPHEALLDQTGGVDFRKGCYVGQEVVSRMQHRGTARTRLVPVRLDERAQPGEEVRAGDRTLGTLGSVVGERALALLRLDRVEEALASGTPLRAAGSGVELVRPDWIRFPWPGDIHRDTSA